MISQTRFYRKKGSKDKIVYIRGPKIVEMKVGK